MKDFEKNVVLFIAVVAGQRFLYMELCEGKGFKKGGKGIRKGGKGIRKGGLAILGPRPMYEGKGIRKLDLIMKEGDLGDG